MTRRRFHAPPAAFAKGQITLEADEARHLREVLRLKPGDEAFVFNGEGREFRCRVETARRESALLSLLAEIPAASPESSLDLTLAVALLKGDKFDLMVQKTTELGVARIVPVITDRADVKLRDEQDAAKRSARWQRIALEAAKQCGRARVPVIGPPRAATDLLQASADASEISVMFSERCGNDFSTVFAQTVAPTKVIALVGSEGGWSDDEINLAQAQGWRIVTLGGRILRAETAAIAVTTILQHRFGDLR
jgi:16S rRNA (uracil1498-N3)-methyltransferase